MVLILLIVTCHKRASINEGFHAPAHPWTVLSTPFDAFSVPVPQSTRFDFMSRVKYGLQEYPVSDIHGTLLVHGSLVGHVRQEYFFKQMMTRFGVRCILLNTGKKTIDQTYQRITSALNEPLRQ